MKRIFKSLFFFAVVAAMFVGCQEEVDAPKSGVTHVVNFIADREIVKTSYSIDNSTVSYQWLESDQTTDGVEEKFHIFENGVESSSILAVLDDNGLMTISAVFDGTTPENAEYTGYFNAGVSASQEYIDEEYDQTSDVLVAAPVVADASHDINQGIMFSFKRLVSFGQMTLKGLDEGAYVENVVIETLGENAPAIAGEYDHASESFINTSSTIEVEALSEIKDQQSKVVFVSLPVENADFKVTVKTSTETGKMTTYEKVFSKSITLTRGDVKGLNVSLEKAYEDPHANDNGWFLVKDVRALNDGDVIRIANKANDAVASAIGTGKFFTNIKGTFDSDMESLNAPDAIDITLGKSGSAWTLLTSEGYVLENGADLKVAVEADSPTAWTISISGDDATIAIADSDPLNRILYNKNSPRFKTYTSDISASMLLPQIYKKYGTPEEHAVKQEPNISFSPAKIEYTLGSDDFEEPVLNCNSDGTQTWESSDEEFATVDAEGNVTITATEEGEVEITVSVAESDEYLAGEASYTISIVEAPVIGEDYVLVTDVKDLISGNTIVIGSIISNNAASALGADNGNNRLAESVSAKSDDTITINNKVCPIILGGSNDAWTFYIKNEGYLYAAGGTGKNNYLKIEGSLTSPGYWTISISDNGTATIKTSDSTVARNTIMYNSGSGLFSCYASGQSPVAIYALSDGKQSQTLSFGSTTEYKIYTNDDFVAPTLSGAQTDVTYSSSNTSVATVNASTGAVAIVGTGTTTITADAAANDLYRAASASYTINVIAAYESLAALVAAGAPTTNGETVKVTITDAVISGFYKSGSYTNGIFTEVATSDGSKEIEIFCKNVPSDWGIGGKVSATIECPWKLYTSGDNSTWELCPTSWDGFTYTSAPKTLTGLSWTEYTASYTAGSTFSVDGTIKAEYSDGSNKSLQPSEVTVTTEPDLSKEGSTSATISYSEGGVTKSATVNITVTGGQGGESQTYTYAFTSNDWKDSTSSWTSVKKGNAFTSGQGVQVTTGTTGASAKSNSSYTNVSKIVVTYCTNAKAGKGSIKLQVGSGTVQSFSVNAPSSSGTTLKEAEFVFNPSETGAVTITVECGTNSIYINSIAISAN